MKKFETKIKITCGLLFPLILIFFGIPVGTYYITDLLIRGIYIVVITFSSSILFCLAFDIWKDDKERNSRLFGRWNFSEHLAISERERNISLWFTMWLNQKDLGIDYIFSEDVVYTESWGPKYDNRKTVKHWFHEWNKRGKVICWDIKQFFHKENQTIVEWYFKNRMDTGKTEEFDGISLIEWTADNKIKSLKEFGCNQNNYNPYQYGDKPQFRDEKANWF